MYPLRIATYISLLTLAASMHAFGLDQSIPSEIPDEPFDLRAAKLEYTNEIIVASGGVTGLFENVVVTAEHLSANPETGELHLEGDIHFERDDVIWNGTSLDYNYITQTGNFGPSSLNFDPILMSVDSIERLSTNEYRLQGATFTTCAKEHPHYRVRVKEAELVDEKYLKGKGATFYLGHVPILYVPFWRQTLSKSIFRIRAGYGSEWGLYGLINATVPLSSSVDSITDLNLYSRRGVGVGQGFAWNNPKLTGEFRSFYLADQDPTAKYDLPELDTDRYRLNLENLKYFSDQHYLNMKWNYLSDPVVLKEFFRSEYRRYAQPENYASWVYGNNYIGSEAFANYRLNDFYNNTDRLEYSLDLYRTRLGSSPFYLQSENSISHLDRVYADTNTLDNVDSVRIDSANTIYMPQRYGFLRLVPRTGYRATYYSKNAVDRSEEYRGITSAGVEVAMQASKVLSDRERWYGRGLRHKIEPYFDYVYEDSSTDSSRLYPFDAVDTLDDRNLVKIGLRNVLQTKRADHLSRFIDVDLYTHYLVDRNGSPDDFDSLFIDARMPLTRRTTIDVDGMVDWNNGTVPFFNTRYSYKKSSELTLSLEHLYWNQEDLSLWSPRFDLFPEGRFSYFGYARYEDRDNDLEEIALGGYVNWCCMRYGLGYHYYDQDDHAIMLSIGLSAFPEASISSGF